MPAVIYEGGMHDGQIPTEENLNTDRQLNEGDKKGDLEE